MTVINTKKLTIENCSIESNEGFQILSTDSVLIINSYFVRSSTTIFDVQRSTVVIRESVFAGNIAGLQRFQGLMSSDDSSVTIENCVFANNLVNSSFAGLLFLSSFGAREDLVIVNSTFVNNSAGGGLVNGLLSFFESVVIYGCTFSNNIVENQTGAVVVRGQSVEIMKSLTLHLIATASTISVDKLWMCLPIVARFKIVLSTTHRLEVVQPV